MRKVILASISIAIICFYSQSKDSNVTQVEMIPDFTLCGDSIFCAKYYLLNSPKLVKNEDIATNIELMVLKNVAEEFKKIDKQFKTKNLQLDEIQPCFKIKLVKKDQAFLCVVENIINKSIHFSTKRIPIYLSGDAGCCRAEDDTHFSYDYFKKIYICCDIGTVKAKATKQIDVTDAIKSMRKFIMNDSASVGIDGIVLINGFQYFLTDSNYLELKKVPPKNILQILKSSQQ